MCALSDSKEKRREYSRRWRAHNLEKAREYAKKYYEINKSKINKSQTEYQKRKRIRVLSRYSNGIPHCACCGEDTYEFLALDHIDGNGSKHRRELGLKTGRDTYDWVIKNNFPDGFQVLCHNCNFASGHYKICPHKLK